MAYQMDAGAQRRLEEYYAEVGVALNNKKRREAFAIYALGLFSELPRKSVEPIAAAFSGKAERCSALHQKLLHFAAESPWSDREVRGVAAKHAIKAMAKRAPLHAWIFDDTGFLKQGKHSVGVKRQYTGSAGKVCNCQVGVTLVVANEYAHVPIDAELYLPEEWVNDPKRRREAGIPDEGVFKTKQELALEMFARAVDDEVPGDIVLADGDYGRSYELRTSVRAHGFDYGLGIHSSMRMWRMRRDGQRAGPVRSAAEIADSLPRSAFRCVTWREGTNEPLSSRFALCRVLLARDGEIDAVEDEPVWLLVEKRGEDKPTTHYAITTLPRRMSRKQIVRLVKERYRTEQAYEEMKTELGLDHYEGRSFRGWHHHVSVVFCCYAFVIGERMRRFPPSAAGEGSPDAQSLAA
jgi:SRSO17 transposase